MSVIDVLNMLVKISHEKRGDILKSLDDSDIKQLIEFIKRNGYMINLY